MAFYRYIHEVEAILIKKVTKTRTGTAHGTIHIVLDDSRSLSDLKGEHMFLREMEWLEPGDYVYNDRYVFNGELRDLWRFCQAKEFHIMFSPCEGNVNTHEG